MIPLRKLPGDGTRPEPLSDLPERALNELMPVVAVQAAYRQCGPVAQYESGPQRYGGPGLGPPVRLGRHATQLAGWRQTSTPREALQESWSCCRRQPSKGIRRSRPGASVTTGYAVTYAA